MSLTALEHALMLGRLLPEGPVWPTSDQSIGADAFHRLLQAMAVEPSRVGASLDLIPEEAIPDNPLTDLDAWERIVGIPIEPLTDAERLDRIRAILNGPGTPDLTTLEDFIKIMAGNPNVRLFNRVGPRSFTGAAAAQCGDRLRAGAWDYTALCELMPNILSVAPDQFESWATFIGTVTQVVSPVTLASTADQFTLQALPSYVVTPLVGTADNDVVYASMWISMTGTGTQTFEFGFLKRDGTTSVSTFTITKGGAWHRLTHQAPIGAGATTPYLRLAAVGASPVVRMSWAVAGVRNVLLEKRIMTQFPFHNFCHFGVIGEYATLLSHDQTLVGW